MPQGDMNSGTAEGMLIFLDYLAEKGHATQGAVEPWKVASRNILSKLEGDSWESTDIKALDVEDTFNRFATKFRQDYSQGSLDVYRKRFEKAVGLYREFLADPAGWKPPKQRPATPRRKKAEDDGRTNGATVRQPVRQSRPEDQTPPDLDKHTIRLKHGGTAILQVPPNLHPEDAERLTIFIRSVLVMEPMLQLPAQTELPVE
jgi:hypothetical protein